MQLRIVEGVKQILPEEYCEVPSGPLRLITTYLQMQTQEDYLVLKGPRL